MLPRVHRLTDAYSYRRVKQKGVAVHFPIFVLSFVQNGLPITRVGFIASSKVGTAVYRNRAVRLLRVAIREYLPYITAGYDIVCIAKKQITTESSSHVSEVMASAIEKTELRNYARIQNE